VRQRVLEFPEVQRAIDQYPNDPIVRYVYPQQQMQVLFAHGADALKKYFTMRAGDTSGTQTISKQRRFNAEEAPLGKDVLPLAVSQSVGNYPGTRATYQEIVSSSILEYLRGDVGMLVSKNAFKQAMVNAFSDSFETGFLEGGGGDTYDPDPEDIDWLAARMEQELGYIALLYYSLKEIKDGATVEEPVTDEDMKNIANDRAAGYARTLDGVLAQGKLRGKKNIMLTFGGSDGQESCPTCQKYKGVSHRAKWWVSHDLIPSPGNENFECGGYQCQHILSDADGNQWAGVTE
jgi:hypothetical protein